MAITAFSLMTFFSCLYLPRYHIAIARTTMPTPLTTRPATSRGTSARTPCRSARLGSHTDHNSTTAANTRACVARVLQPQTCRLRAPQDAPSLSTVPRSRHASGTTRRQFHTFIVDVFAFIDVTSAAAALDAAAAAPTAPPPPPPPVSSMAPRAMSADKGPSTSSNCVREGHVISQQEHWALRSHTSRRSMTNASTVPLATNVQSCRMSRSSCAEQHSQSYDHSTTSQGRAYRLLAKVVARGHVPHRLATARHLHACDP